MRQGWEDMRFHEHDYSGVKWVHLLVGSVPVEGDASPAGPLWRKTWIACRFEQRSAWLVLCLRYKLLTSYGLQMMPGDADFPFV